MFWSIRLILCLWLKFNLFFILISFFPSKFLILFVLIFEFLCFWFFSLCFWIGWFVFKKQIQVQVQVVFVCLRSNVYNSLSSQIAMWFQTHIQNTFGFCSRNQRFNLTHLLFLSFETQMILLFYDVCFLYLISLLPDLVLARFGQKLFWPSNLIFSLKFLVRFAFNCGFNAINVLFGVFKRNQVHLGLLL